MPKTLKIYLAGSIQKGHEQNSSFWSETDLNVIRKNLSDYEVIFLNPASRSDDLSDQKSVFGRDMLQVYCSDLVFVDARDRRGLGVGAEMMWAKINQIPIITLAPLDTHYHKKETTLLGITVEDWIHPFVESLSDVVVENLFLGCEWIKTNKLTRGACKDNNYIIEAMQHYQACQFANDEPMKSLFKCSAIFQERYEIIKASQI
jgi:hypothetical protein